MSPRTRLLIAALILSVFGLIYFSGSLTMFATDWMWFDAAGFGSVFTTTVLAQILLGVLCGSGVAAWVALNAGLAIRLSPNRGNLFIPGDFLATPPGRALAAMNLVLPLGLAVGLVALFSGLTASSWWDEALLAVYAAPFGVQDPVFGLDVGFYVFDLALISRIQVLITGAVFIATVGVLPVYVLRGGITVLVEIIEGRLAPRGLRMHDNARRHLVVLVAILGVCMGVGTLLGSFELLYRPGELITGMGYADVYGALPAVVLRAIGVFLAGGLFCVAIALKRPSPFAIGIASLLGTQLLGSIYPNLLQSVWVEPTELEVETPYIERHIEATRSAFDLKAVEESRLSGEAELSAVDIAANRATIDNVNLWNHGPLLATFSQVQEIRTYYDFVSVDNDRYMIDGQLRQIMLSPRELVASSLPSQARTFVNETMIYTHGYGLALGPVNEVTEQGLPKLFVKDLPPKVQYEDDLSIEQPAIYYGEATTNSVLVNTKNNEFDYPAGEQNVYSKYSGDGGVPISGLLARTLFSMRLGSSQILLTGDITDDSRILLYRNIRERARRVAPFLRFDRDPFMVIDQGRLMWVLDAYTTSSHYPYAQQVGAVGNYMRNSVKATIDAYDGTLTFYRTNDADPIADAWASIFPDLMKPIDEMPPTLRDHMRYPEDLFTVQAGLFGIYHMTEPNVFYNREDAWEVPAVEGQYMKPYYTVMKLPGEAEAEFIVMLPFNPVGKPNLAAWIIARNDGEGYGKLQAYKFPKEKLIYGPEQIVARIQQDAEISQRISLWNQQGSQARRGTLLVIPIEESLVYIQPLYLQAESGSIPELKRVIVGYRDQIAMERTLDEALDVIFKDTEPVVSEPSETPDGSAALDTRSLVLKAKSTFEAATAAQRAGDWSKYGDELDTLEELLTQLADRSDDADSSDEEGASESPASSEPEPSEPEPETPAP